MSFINKCGQTSVLGLFQPGCPFPYIFHRAVRVVIHPPAAERELQDEENYSCQAAGCDTKLIVQCKSPVVVWGIERSGFFNGREKWAKGFENQRV